MVKYVHFGASTKAMINDNKYDAAIHVAKRLGLSPKKDEKGIVRIDTSAAADALELEKLLLRDEYSGTVTLVDGDTYSKSIGEDEALSKASKNYRTAYNKALKRWMKAVILKLYDINGLVLLDTMHEIISEKGKSRQETKKTKKVK